MRQVVAFALSVVFLLGVVTPVMAQGQASIQSVTDQERAYFDQLQADIKRVGELSTEMSNLFTQAGTTPAVMFNDTWRIKLAALLVEWEQFHADAQLMQPSPRQQHIHAIWLAVTELMAKSTDDFITGIDAIDAASIERGTARVVYAALLMDDITSAVLAFNANPDAPFVGTHALPPVETCDSFPSYPEAQQYYAAYPDAQPVIDPDWDSLACEVFFGMG